MFNKLTIITVRQCKLVLAGLRSSHVGPFRMGCLDSKNSRKRLNRTWKPSSTRMTPVSQDTTISILVSTIPRSINPTPGHREKQILVYLPRPGSYQHHSRHFPSTAAVTTLPFLLIPPLLPPSTISGTTHTLYLMSSLYKAGTPSVDLISPLAKLLCTESRFSFYFPLFCSSPFLPCILYCIAVRFYSRNVELSKT